MRLMSNKNFVRTTPEHRISLIDQFIRIISIKSTIECNLNIQNSDFLTSSVHVSVIEHIDCYWQTNFQPKSGFFGTKKSTKLGVTSPTTTPI